MKYNDIEITSDPKDLFEYINIPALVASQRLETVSKIHIELTGREWLLDEARSLRAMDIKTFTKPEVDFRRDNRGGPPKLSKDHITRGTRTGK